MKSPSRVNHSSHLLKTFLFRQSHFLFGPYYNDKNESCENRDKGRTIKINHVTETVEKLPLKLISGGMAENGASHF